MSQQFAHLTPPRVEPDAGWSPCRPLPHEEGADLFVSGGREGGRFRMAFYIREADRHLVGRVWFGPETEGPPGHAHGGSVAAVMDHALGSASWAAGHPILVARLTVDFRRMVPIGIDARFDTWVERVDGRKVHTRGRLYDDTGETLAEGHAICVMLKGEHIEKFTQVKQARRRRPHGAAPGGDGTDRH